MPLRTQRLSEPFRTYNILTVTASSFAFRQGSLFLANATLAISLLLLEKVAERRMRPEALIFFVSFFYQEKKEKDR